MQQAGRSPFQLDLPIKPPFKKMVQAPIEKVFCLSTFDSMYSQIRGDIDFLQNVLDLLGVSVDVAEKDLENIPEKGAAVVVANHPYGGIEGVILLHVLRQVRPDVKVLANHLLGQIPEMREYIIEVDPFEGKGSAQKNIQGLKRALRWIRQGGLLVIFPAGEVSSIQLHKAVVTDPKWSSTAGRIIRIAKAPVIPAHFPGHNGPLFHMLGLIHPILRTMLLPREFLNKQKKSIELRFGKPVSARKISSARDDDSLTSLLRLRTYLLEKRRHLSQLAASKPLPATLQNPKPIGEAFSPEALEREIESLDSRNVLVEQGEYRVVCFEGRELPSVLLELGRLREVSFREVGEGTGEPRDLDSFDEYYQHLVLWNVKSKEIVGAYRIGCADRIAESRGLRGLYTSTLFKFSKDFLSQLGPSLELGRAFVSSAYRKSYNPLMLLWKGIAAFVYREGRYRVLFGPVSISNDYQPFSRKMIMKVLKAHHSTQKCLTKAARPLSPPRIRSRVPGGFKMGSVAALCPSVDDLNTAISDIESDGKGIPVLLRQYLKLGGTVLTFNLDRDFGDAIDGLMVVDLAKTPQKTLSRYMGKAKAEEFYQRHRQGIREQGA